MIVVMRVELMVMPSQPMLGVNDLLRPRVGRGAVPFGPCQAGTA